MLDPENLETLAATDLEAAKTAWAEWEAVSAATEEAYRRWQLALRGRTPHRIGYAAKAAWEATLPRTDAARKAVAGLPDPQEIAAYELHVESMRLEKAKQGKLL